MKHKFQYHFRLLQSKKIFTTFLKLLSKLTGLVYCECPYLNIHSLYPDNCKEILTSLKFWISSSLVFRLCFWLQTSFLDSSMYFLLVIEPLTLFQTLQTLLHIYIHILTPSSYIISHFLDRWGSPLYLQSAVNFQLF